MSYSKVNSMTETLHAVKPRRVCCDINQADKINAKIRLSLAYESHGYRLSDNPPIYLNDGRSVSLRGDK